MKPKILELTEGNRIPAKLRIKYFKAAIKNGMKLVTFDMETSHATVRTFYIGSKVSIPASAVIHPTKIITVQYAINNGKPKYLAWDKVSNKFEGSGNFDDASMVEEFTTSIYNEADLILTQNGDGFDHKILVERAKVHKTTPPTRTIPSIDILKLSRAAVRPMSHKLDYRSKQQGLGGKHAMRDSDWVDIEERGVSVMKKMVPYGLKDITDTYNLFWKELPYYKDIPKAIESVVLKFLTGGEYAHPGRVKKTVCPKCRKKRRLATDITFLRGNTYLCNNCGKKFNSSSC